MIAFQTNVLFLSIRGQMSLWDCYCTNPISNHFIMLGSIDPYGNVTGIVFNHRFTGYWDPLTTTIKFT
jgi:hypothetical protein